MYEQQSGRECDAGGENGEMREKVETAVELENQDIRG